MKTILEFISSFNSFIGNIFIITNSVSKHRDLLFEYCNLLYNCSIKCYLRFFLCSHSSLVKRHLNDLIVVPSINIGTYSYIVN